MSYEPFTSVAGFIVKYIFMGREHWTYPNGTTQSWPSSVWPSATPFDDKLASEGDIYFQAVEKEL